MEKVEIQSVLEKVEKLLRLAAVNPNENEAASATAKAQELLAAYNLDMAAVEENRDGGGRRMMEMYEGGRFEWQRDLWEAVAQLNFCIYVNKTVFVITPLGKEQRFVKGDDGVSRRQRGMFQHRHQIVGRKVNVIATNAMASYLEGVCDRLTKERVRATNERRNGRWANSYREGITQKVICKIFDRRQELLDEEKRTAFAARQKAAEDLANSGISTATALTLSSYKDQEHDANIDFIYGEGTSAKWAAERAQQAAAKRAAEEEYTRWAAANPEQARKLEEERKRKLERERDRRDRKYFKKQDGSAWMEGWKAGDAVSLDQQAEQRKAAGYLK